MSQQGSPECIIVIDDQEEFRKMAKVILEARGYSVLTAPNGKEGIELYKLHRTKVKVVVTDMEMPLMNGPATIRQLIEIDPKIKIIAVSGVASYAGIPLNYPGSAVRFLHKPYRLEEFDNALETLKCNTANL